MSTPATHAFVSVDLLDRARDTAAWSLEYLVTQEADFDDLGRPVVRSMPFGWVLYVEDLTDVLNELDAALEGTVGSGERAEWMADVLSGALPLFEPKPDDVACTDAEGGCRHDH